MSLNASHTPDGNGILLYAGELILIYTKHVELTFSRNNNIAFRGRKGGDLFLTTHRILFLNERKTTPLTTFAMPLYMLQEVRLEQPFLGANFLKGTIQALPNGNFTGSVEWKLLFRRGGCIDFGQALLKAWQMARSNQHAAPPPAYLATPPLPYFSPPPPDYQYFTSSYHGFVAPTAKFPERPNANTVFMYDAPPPYPGIAPAPPASSHQPTQVPHGFYPPQHMMAAPNTFNPFSPYPQGMQPFEPQPMTANAAVGYSTSSMVPPPYPGGPLTAYPTAGMSNSGNPQQPPSSQSNQHQSMSGQEPPLPIKIPQ